MHKDGETAPGVSVDGVEITFAKLHVSQNGKFGSLQKEGRGKREREREKC